MKTRWYYLALLLFVPALMGFRACGSDVDIGGSHPEAAEEDDASASYDPCEGLSCGEQCSQCPPDDPGCIEPAVLNYCQSDGTCSATEPKCVNCDPSDVYCRALPPECGEGEVPSVEGN